MPPEGPQHETDAQRRARESRSAEAFARRVLIPVDGKTGVRFVRGEWFQRYMRLSLGPSATPHQARDDDPERRLEGARAETGRIKATNPEDGRALILDVLSRGEGLGGATGAR